MPLRRFSLVTSAGTEKVEEEQRKRFGTTPGEGDGRYIEFICLLCKPNQSPQAGPLREQYKTPAAQIKRWGGGIPSYKQDVRVAGFGGWTLSLLCVLQLLMRPFACVWSTHPGIAVGGSRPVAERLGWVFVVDLQAGVIRNAPASERGQRR